MSFSVFCKMFSIPSCCCVLFNLVLVFQLMRPSSGFEMENDTERIGTGWGSNRSSMVPEELAALFDIMETMVDDPTWRSTHARPCTDNPWPGISCEATPDAVLHVTKLHIGLDYTAACRRDAKLSSAILKLRYLKSLFVFECFKGFQFEIPSDLAEMSPSLEELTLKSNKALVGLIPPDLSGLGRLRVLSLSQNSLRGGIPSELGKLKNLRHLDLSYNNLSGSIPGEFGSLKSLSILDLSGNNLQGSIPPSIGSLKLLQKIDLSFNKFSGRIPSELGMLKSLSFLALGQNFFTGPFPETFQALTELQYLMVERNAMNSTLPDFFGSLTNLSALSLSSSGFEGPIPRSFCSLNSLSALALDNNRLNGSIPADLGALQKLYQLNLSENFLSGQVPFSADFVKRLGSKLDLRGNQDLCVSKPLAQYLSVGSEFIHRCSNSTNLNPHGKVSGDITTGLNTSKPRPNRGLSDTNSSQKFQFLLWITCLLMLSL